MSSNLGPLAEFSSRPVFQLSVPTRDLSAMRAFYVETLGSKIERESVDTIEFTFFGGILVAHLVSAAESSSLSATGARAVPLPNFGLIMSWEDWHRAVDHLNYVGVTYRVAPAVRILADSRHEALFAIVDPGDNCLVFCAYKSARAV